MRAGAGHGHRRAERRGARLAVGTMLAVLLAAGLPAPGEAAAGSYRVLACDAAPGGTAGAWKARADRGMVTATTCPARGAARRGLAVRNRPNAGWVPRGAAAAMRFTAPAGATLTRIDYRWSGRRAGRDWGIGLVDDEGRALAGCPTASGPARCRLRGSGSRRLARERSVQIEARCLARGGCDTRRPRGSGDGTRARLAVQSAVVEVADRRPPSLAGTDGSLLSSAWQRGRREVDVEAADPVGVRALELEVDGRTRAGETLRCDYARRAPCPAIADRTYRLDTASLPDGVHEVAVRATDTAGNTRRLERTIRVDNHAPLRVRDISLVGSPGTRSRNSFDLRWAPPGGQVSPLAGARYRLCRTGTDRCVHGARAGALAGIEDLAVPGRGEWRFEVWLDDEAGNADPANASAPVVLAFDDREPTRLSAGVPNGRGGLSGSATVDFDALPMLEGSLRGSDGTRLGGQRIAVLERRRGSSRMRRAATVRSARDGSFDYRPRSGPSRTIRFRFEGGERHRPADAVVDLTVRAISTIRASRKSARNGDSVRFDGRLRGGHVPPEGKLVQLEVFTRGRWRTFQVVRSDARGRWEHRYRFGGTRGRVRYPFRARVPRERAYPYAVGTSRTVRVVVNG